MFKQIDGIKLHSVDELGRTRFKLRTIRPEVDEETGYRYINVPTAGPGPGYERRYIHLEVMKLHGKVPASVIHEVTDVEFIDGDKSNCNIENLRFTGELTMSQPAKAEPAQVVLEDVDGTLDDDESDVIQQVTKEQVDPDDLMHPTQIPDEISIDENTIVSLSEVVIRAFEQSGLSVEGWNSMDGAVIEQRCHQVIYELTAARTAQVAEEKGEQLPKPPPDEAADAATEQAPVEEDALPPDFPHAKDLIERGYTDLADIKQLAEQKNLTSIKGIGPSKQNDILAYFGIQKAAPRR